MASNLDKLEASKLIEIWKMHACMCNKQLSRLSVKYIYIAHSSSRPKQCNTKQEKEFW